MWQSHIPLVTILDTVVDIIGGRAYTITRRIFTSTMNSIFNKAPRKFVRKYEICTRSGCERKVSEEIWCTPNSMRGPSKSGRRSIFCSIFAAKFLFSALRKFCLHRSHVVREEKHAIAHGLRSGNTRW